MKKVIFCLLFLLLLFGCTEYSVIGYKKSNIDLKNYYIKVGFLINHHSKQNKFPKRGLIFHLENKYDSENKTEILNVTSNMYGAIDVQRKRSYFNKEYIFYLKDLSFEKEKITKKKILSDTIKAQIRENGEVKTILFFNDAKKKL
jgi:hypothetical protein